MRNFVLIAVTSTLLTFGGASMAYADDCSGHDHDTGTAVGAVGGGVIGGLATHSVVGGLAGAVVGGVVGNSVARSDDCEHHEDRANEHAYNQGYEDRAAEERDAPPPRPDPYPRD